MARRKGTDLPSFNEALKNLANQNLTSHYDCIRLLKGGDHVEQAKPCNYKQEID